MTMNTKAFIKMLELLPYLPAYKRTNASSRDRSKAFKDRRVDTDLTRTPDNYSCHIGEFNDY